MRDPYIDVDMKNGTTYTARSVYQYDHGLKIRLINLDNSSTVTAQFAIEGGTRSVDVFFQSSDNVLYADIPNHLLMQERKIKCYIYVETTDSGVTVKEVHIPVIPRAKPDTTAFTQEQVQGYAFLLQQLRSMIEDTEEAQKIIKDASEAADYLLNIEMEVNQDDGCLYITIPD